MKKDFPTRCLYRSLLTDAVCCLGCCILILILYTRPKITCAVMPSDTMGVVIPYMKSSQKNKTNVLEYLRKQSRYILVIASLFLSIFTKLKFCYGSSYLAFIKTNQKSYFDSQTWTDYNLPSSFNRAFALQTLTM